MAWHDTVAAHLGERRVGGRGALARAVVLVGAAIPCSTFALKMREDAAKDPAEAARRRDDDDGA